jgi:hypothetical protein
VLGGLPGFFCDKRVMADHIENPELPELLTPEKSGRFSPSWFAENVLKPAINAGPLGVYNTAADLASLPTVHLQTDEVEPYSPEWFARGIAGGIGASVPFALMGAASERLMGSLDRKLSGTAVGAALSPYLNSERVATVAGASLYAALQRPDAGHTRLGNAAGTAAGMSVFIGGSALVKDLPMMGKAVAFPIIGFAGGATMVEVSQLASNLKFAPRDQALQGAVLGTTMNTVMGLGAEYVSRRVEQDPHAATNKIAIPLDTDGCSTRISMDHHDHDHDHESAHKKPLAPLHSMKEALDRAFSPADSRGR